MQKRISGIIIILLLSMSSIWAAEFKVEVPKFVLSDIATPCEISAINGHLPSFVFQVREGQIISDTLFFGHHFNYSFDSIGIVQR